MMLNMIMIPLPLHLPLLAMVLQTPQLMSAQEIDPCYNYTVLNDTWRATANLGNSDLKCDRDVQWQGWYLMVYQDVSVRMPSVCVPKERCGTHAPLWLNGSHPLPEDGIVTREVCGHWISDCCLFKSSPIQVKECPGNYTVYKFVKPVGCYLAYCADLSNRGVLPTKHPAPITRSVGHVVGLRLEVSSVDIVNETEIEENVLKPLGDKLRAQGVEVTGIQLRRFYEAGSKGKTGKA